MSKKKKKKRLSLCQWPTIKYSFKDGHNIQEIVSGVSGQQSILAMVVQRLTGIKILQHHYQSSYGVQKQFFIMVVDPVSGTVQSPPGGVDGSDDQVSEEGVLAFDESISMSTMGQGGDGSKTGCAMCRRTLSNGKSRSNHGLKIVIAKGLLKNIYMQTQAWPIKNIKSRVGS